MPQPKRREAALGAITRLERLHTLAAAGAIKPDEFSRLHGAMVRELAGALGVEPASPPTSGRWDGLLCLLFAALGTAAAVGIALSSSKRAMERMSGPRPDGASWLPTLAVLGGGGLVAAAGHAAKDTALGSIALGAGSSAAGFALTIMILALAGQPAPLRESA